jgi:hypothetical protein
MHIPNYDPDGIVHNSWCFYTVAFMLSLTACLAHLLIHGATAAGGPGPPHYRGCTITLRDSTFGRTSLGEWSAQSRDLFLKTYNTHKVHTSMAPAGFELAVVASELLQTHALDAATRGFGSHWLNPFYLELDIYSLAHHLCTVWIFYEPRRVTLGNTRYFVGE